MAALDFDAYIRDTQFKRQMDAMERRVMSFSRNVEQSTSKIDSGFSRIGQTLGGLFVGSQLLQLPQQIVKVRGEFQQLEVAFKTMLGSKEKADKLLAQSVELAAKTPFSLRDVGQGAKQLIAYGSASEDVTEELRRLGDISAGVSAPLNDIVYLYGTLRTQGRAYTQDIRQFAGRGIPIYRELAKVLQINEQEVNKYVEAGKVGFKEVQQALENMTNEGGTFFNLMEEQSKTLTGLTSNLGDAFDQMFNSIGQDTEGVIASALKGTIALVENYEEVLKILTVLVATYGAYRAALIATYALQAAGRIYAAVEAWVALARTVRTAKDAQIAFNLATSASPLGVIVAILGAAAAAYAVYGGEMSEAEKVANKVAEAERKVSEEVAVETAKIELLKREVQNANLTYGERQKKLNELIALSPKHLSGLTQETLATKEGAAALDSYVASMKRKIQADVLNQQYIESVRRETLAQDSDNLGFLGQFQAAAIAYSGGSYEKAKAEISKVNTQQAIEAEQKLQKQLLEKLDTVQKVDEVQQQTTETVKKSVSYYDEEIKALKEKQAAESTSRKEFLDYEKQIAALEAKKAGIDGKVAGGSGGKTAEKDKPQPFGSLAYWDEVIRKAEEALSKTPETDSAEIARQQQIIIEARKKAEEVGKVIAIRSYAEEIEEKKKQYEKFEAYVRTLGESAARQQFADLLKTGETYADFLNGEIERLRAKESAGALFGQDAENLVKLSAELDALKGIKTPVEEFRDELDKAVQNANGLTAALEILNAEKAKLDTAPNTADTFEKRKLVAEQIVDTERARSEQVKQFLSNIELAEDRHLDITRRYGQLRVDLEATFADKKSKEYIDGLKKIRQEEDRERTEVNRKLLEESEEYKALSRVIKETGQEGLRIRIEALNTALAKAKQTLGEESEEYKRLLRERQEAENQYKQNQITILNQFAQLGGQFGEALSQANGALGEMGRLLSGVASSARNLLVAFDENATKSDKIQAGIAGLVDLIGLVINAAKQRRQAEAEYYRDMIAFQQEYNLLINEQLGMQAELNESVFVKDFVGRMQDGVKQFSEAQKQYQEALRKLGEGQVKNGQKNAVDLGAVGKAAGSGAAIGAAVGTVLPVVGTAVGAAVGAVVGGIVGLFAGKKKKDTFVGILEAYPQLIETSADGTERLNESLAKALLNSNQLDDSTKQLVENILDWQEAMDEAQKQILDIVGELAGSLGDDLRNSLVDAFRQGEDAAKAFGDSVSKTLENIISQLLFSQVFSGAFKQLEQEMQDSFGVGGDGSWLDDLGRFFALSGQLNAEFEKGLEEAQKAAEAYGLDIFKSGAGKGKDKNSLSGAIQGMSQETAGLLAGQFNALRISGAEVALNTRSSLIHLSEIATNTRFLVNIDKTLRDIKNSDTRSQGFPK